MGSIFPNIGGDGPESVSKSGELSLRNCQHRTRNVDAFNVKAHIQQDLGDTTCSAGHVDDGAGSPERSERLSHIGLFERIEYPSGQPRKALFVIALSDRDLLVMGYRIPVHLS